MKRADTNTNSTVDRRQRNRRNLSCDRCPPHDGENRGRRVRSDKYKNKRN